MSDASGLPPAGWYPDPAGSGDQRWWDGGSWTAHTQKPLPPLKPESGQEWLERNEPMPAHAAQPAQPVDQVGAGQPTAQAQPGASATQGAAESAYPQSFPWQQQAQPTTAAEPSAWPTQTAQPVEPVQPSAWPMQTSQPSVQPQPVQAAQPSQWQQQGQPAQPQDWQAQPAQPQDWQAQPAQPQDWQAQPAQQDWQAQPAQPQDWQPQPAQPQEPRPWAAEPTPSAPDWSAEPTVAAPAPAGGEAGPVWQLDEVAQTAVPASQAADRFPLEFDEQPHSAAPPAFGAQPADEPSSPADMRQFLTRTDPAGDPEPAPALTRRDARASAGRTRSERSTRPADTQRATNYASLGGLLIALIAVLLCFMPELLPEDLRIIFYGVAAVGLLVSVLGIVSAGRLNSGRWVGVAGAVIAVGAAAYAYFAVPALQLVF